MSPAARALLLLFPSLAAAQTTAVRGAVRLADGAGVLGATVWIAGALGAADTSIAATTDANGAYQFTLPLRDGATLVVRRRGFRDTAVVAPAAAVSRGRRSVQMTDVTLTPAVAPALAAVVREGGGYVGRDAMFYRHLQQRRGDFLTRDQIARQAAARTSMLLRGRRGVTLITSGSGTYVRLRGGNCFATVFIDGASTGTRGFDVDMLSPNSLVGIEIYPDIGTLPVEYQTGDATACGAVGFWTRRGGDAGGGDFEVASVVEPTAVRLPSEVDRPAAVVDSGAFAPGYPPSRRAVGKGGSVVIELVVDTVGTVERSSVGVAALSDAELAESTLRAAERLRFIPAMHRGATVRQLVHLVARFEPGAVKVEKQ